MDFLRVLNHLNKVNETGVLTLAEANAFAQEGFHIFNRFKHQDIAKGRINFDDTIDFLSEYTTFPFENKVTGAHLHFNGIHNGVLKMNQQGTSIKTTYQMKGTELVVQLDGEEITFTEEKVRGFIKREKEIMNRIAKGNYLEKF